MSTDRTILVINGRVYEVRPSRSVGSCYLSGSVAWWGALAVWGALVLGLAAFVGVGLGAMSAIGGVVWFLGAGVLAGWERYELATALAVSGIVWTSTGIAVYLGTDSFLGYTVIAFAVVGLVALVIGRVGAFRWAHGESVRPNNSARR